MFVCVCGVFAKLGASNCDAAFYSSPPIHLADIVISGFLHTRFSWSAMWFMTRVGTFSAASELLRAVRTGHGAVRSTQRKNE